MIHTSSEICRPGSAPASSLASCKKITPAAVATAAAAIAPSTMGLGLAEVSNPDHLTGTGPSHSPPRYSWIVHS